MKTLSLIENEIILKIKSISDHLASVKLENNEKIDKIPDYLSKISSLEKKNLQLQAKIDTLNTEHRHDLKKIDELLSSLESLVEKSNE